MHIIEVANRLFYHQGYGSTSFADIVDETGLSKGNITYHFKNKQIILEEVIRQRLDGINRQFAGWDTEFQQPIERLLRFCDMLVDEQHDLARFGCPMGTLTGEFAKNEPELYQITLAMLKTFRGWLSRQYRQLGHSDADEQALSLLARVQGIAVIAHTFHDQAFVQREIEQLKQAISRHYR